MKNKRTRKNKGVNLMQETATRQRQKRVNFLLRKKATASQMPISSTMEMFPAIRSTQIEALKAKRAKTKKSGSYSRRRNVFVQIENRIPRSRTLKAKKRTKEVE